MPLNLASLKTVLCVSREHKNRKSCTIYLLFIFVADSNQNISYNSAIFKFFTKGTQWGEVIWTTSKPLGFSSYKTLKASVLKEIWILKLRYLDSNQEELVNQKLRFELKLTTLVVLLTLFLHSQPWYHFIIPEYYAWQPQRET